jgi:hypothetical protein
MAATLAFTLAEAATVLDPPMTERQLYAIVHALGWQPAGKRYTGHGGHPRHTYEAAEIMALHAAIAPFLATARDSGDR